MMFQKGQQKQIMDENSILKALWIDFAQHGVKIDYIQDNKTVVYSVPSMSDFVIGNKMMAGEDLIKIMNEFFEENGFHSEGRIRSEYWTTAMGDTAAKNMQKEIEETE